MALKYLREWLVGTNEDEDEQEQEQPQPMEIETQQEVLAEVPENNRRKKFIRIRDPNQVLSKNQLNQQSYPTN